MRSGTRGNCTYVSPSAIYAASGGDTDAPTESPTLEATGLVREYGPVTAVDGVDLSLDAGEFLTIFGPNGAGKTSLLGMLAGATRPTRGEVKISGLPISLSEHGWRSKVGILSHRGFLYARLTAEENLRFYGELFGLDDLSDRIAEHLERVGLADRARFEVRQLSHGMRQRLSLARALLHDPDVVFLDEPYTGLDPSAAGLLRAVLNELKDGRRTVVMVTHNIAEGLQMATRVAIQVGGRFVWEQDASAIEFTGFERQYHTVVEARS
jgi:heme exporter protein A